MRDDHWKSIPVWGGHWSSVCVYVWMYVYGMMCESARLCEGVEEVPVALLLLPLESSPGFLLLLFWSPKWGQVHLCTNTLSFPCWQLSLLFMVTAGMRKGRTHWCEDATWTLLTQKKKTSKSERTFSPVLSYSVWLALFWSEQKRCEGAPWRFSVGMTSLQCTSCSRGQPQKSWTRGLKKKRKKEKGLLYWPNVLLPSSLCWETGTIIFWVFHDLMTHVEKWNGLN